METIRTEILATVVQRQKHLTNAIAALDIVTNLPNILSDYPADSVSIGTYYGGEHSLSVSLSFSGDGHENRAKELIDKLAELGVVMQREDLSDRELYSKPTNTSWHGELGKVIITVFGMPLPPSCEIEEIESEPQKTFKYKIKCNKQPSAEDSEES